MDLLPRYDFVTPSGCLEKFIENKKAVKFTGEILALHNSNFHLRARILPLATVVSCSPSSSSLIGESLRRLGSAPPWYVAVLPASEHALHGKERLAQLTVQTSNVPSWEMMTFALQCTAEGLHMHFQFRHTEYNKNIY